MHDLSDKQWWCKYGEELEREFVGIASGYGLDACINPEKDRDKYAPDLVVDGRIADLKVQTVPFFTAGRYGLDPQYTVTFNFKSRKQYALYYPDIVIYFLVNWRTLEMGGVTVQPLYGVWRVEFRDMKFGVLHEYKNKRKGGNAKASYLMDLRDFYNMKHSY
jgi:hypothetical protein